MAIERLNPVQGNINTQALSSLKSLVPDVAVPFQSILDDAIETEGQRINPYQGLKDPLTKTKEVSQASQEKSIRIAANEEIAQAVPEATPQPPPVTLEKDLPTTSASGVNAEMRSKKLEITPFHLLINRSIEALEDVSASEMRVNDLIEQYVQNKASIDEVSIETQKLSLSISFVTSVITSATTTFKEILQMQV